MKIYSLIPSFGISLVALVLATSSHAGFASQTINFDFNVTPDEGDRSLGSDDVFAGDDAELSSPGGTFWNSVRALTGAMAVNAPDQFGASSPVDLDVIQTSDFSGLTGANELQDSGLGSSGGQIPQLLGDSGSGGGPVVILPADIAFIVSGLLQSEFYNLALYISDIQKFSTTDIRVEHAGGIAAMNQNTSASFDIPNGIPGGDFHLFNGLLPFDFGGGNYGFTVVADGNSGFNPAYVGGFQIQGVVPEPSTWCLLLVGAATLWRFRRRR